MVNMEFRIPSAFANAVSLAADTEFHKIPISPETIWRAKTGGNMIPFDFEYYKPSTLADSIQLFHE